MASGVLWQVDKGDERLTAVAQIERAVAACVARHGWRPSEIHVHPNGCEWPEAIGEARIVPTPRMSYPGLMLLVGGPEPAGETQTQ